MKDKTLTQSQDLTGKIAADSAGVESILDSILGKVSETAFSSERLPAPLADFYSKQLLLIAKKEEITAMFDTLISFEKDNTAKH